MFPEFGDYYKLSDPFQIQSKTTDFPDVQITLRLALGFLIDKLGEMFEQKCDF